MNLHLERRLEVLAREIAASKTPKIDAAANALFAEAARKHEHKAPSDWARKSNGAAGAPASATCETGNRSVGLGAAPLSAQKFKVGQRWKRRDGRETVIEKMDDSAVPICGDDHIWRDPDGGSFDRRNGWDLVELVSPEPASTPVALGDGWIEYSPGDGAPKVHSFKLLWSDGLVRSYIQHPDSLPDCLSLWDGFSSFEVKAYKVVA